MKSKNTDSSRKKAATKTSRRSDPTEQEIDDRVIAEADDDRAWDAPIHVTPRSAKIGLPASLARRAAFLARLHHEHDTQAWVERVVRERVEIEERAFAQARRDLSSRNGA